jgi:acetylornithine/succinyldiaminopimelate/putrescine aminotransferase
VASWLSRAAITGLVTARSTPPIDRSFARRFNRSWGDLAVSPLSKSDEDLPPLRARLDKMLAGQRCGAVVVEPIQARGGINVPPPDFLPMLRALCDRHGALLVLDEIYTGFGRTGKWFACEESGVTPDLICLGKALTGGFPLSACVGRADIIDAAWPPSTGEAIHTSTFQGNPVGCAMALAQIAEIRSKKLPQGARRPRAAFCLTRCARRFRDPACASKSGGAA